MMSLKIVSLFFVIPILFLGCHVFNNDSGSQTDNIEIHLSIDPAQVNSGEIISVTYAIKNNSTEKIEFVTGCASFANIIACQNEKVVDFQGTSSGCYTSLGHFEIDANKTLEFEWDIPAYGLTYISGERRYDTTYVEPGEYIFKIEPNVGEINGEPATLSATEKTITVQ